MFLYGNLRFRYEPYPIGIVKPALPEDLYEELVDNFPPPQLFAHKPELGNKYSLSYKTPGGAYAKFIGRHKCWNAFHEWIKSDRFIPSVMVALRDCYINLGNKMGKGLTTRFEFSMLPADGGYILPHTDARNKVVTLVVSMARDGEWNSAFGGGTDVNRPKDERLMFNWLNDQAELDQMEVLDTFEYTPNQAVVFIKTYNSWHSVRPMTGTGSPLMRKTLTINIEADKKR